MKQASPNPLTSVVGKLARYGATALTALSLVAAAGVAQAAEKCDGCIKDPARDHYYELYKGKRVVFVPVFMGLDLTEGWSKMMKQQADLLGYDYEVRNANFKTDQGVQILTQLISQNPKPDVIVNQNPDVTSYARLQKQAEAAGIYVVQLNMHSLYTSTGFAGGDATQIGVLQAKWAVKHCGAGTDTSHKILILNGPSTAPWTVYMQEGYEKVLNAHPDVKVVARQSTGNYESAKAKQITEVVLQQHPDLCAVLGVWDNTDPGTAAAVKAAGRTGKTLVSTSGGGGMIACQSLQDKSFDHYVSYDVPGQGRDVNGLVQMALQMKASDNAPGSVKVQLYTPLIDVDAVSDPKARTDFKCWSLDDVHY